MVTADLSAGGRGRRGGIPARPSARRAGGRRSLGEALAARVAPTAAASIALAALAGALLLLARRLGGDLAVPTGAGPVTAAVGAGAVLALAVDRLQPRPAVARYAVRLALALAIAILLPTPWSAPGPGPRAGAWLALAPAVLAALAVLLSPLAPRPAPPARRTRARRPVRRAHSPRPRQVGPPTDPPARPLAPLPAEPLDPGVGRDPGEDASTAAIGPAGIFRQRFERHVSPAEGTEQVRGRIVLSVAAGSRSAAGHVGFCPPFHHQPHVEVGTSCEAVEAAIVAAEILPWGVRVECRLDEPADEALEIPIDIVARAALPPSDPGEPFTTAG